MKAYPGQSSVDESFKLLLMENILKHASRRYPKSIQEEFSMGEVQDILSYYKEAFRQIFSFYASEGFFFYFHLFFCIIFHIFIIFFFVFVSPRCRSPKEAYLPQEINEYWEC